MGDLAQEMWDMAQHNFEACCRLDKRLGNNYSAYRYAEQRIAELEAENARLREAAEKQRAIINNYSLAPDIHKLLRQLHLRQLHEQILGVGDE